MWNLCFFMLWTNFFGCFLGRICDKHLWVSSSIEITQFLSLLWCMLNKKMLVTCVKSSKLQQNTQCLPMDSRMAGNRNWELVHGQISESQLKYTIRLQLTKFSLYLQSEVLKLSRRCRERSPNTVIDFCWKGED